MYLTNIDILDEKGLYPKETVLCDEVGYSRYKGMPLWFSVQDLNNYLRNQRSPRSILLRSAFLMTNRQSPAYNFRPHGRKCSICFNTEEEPDLRYILKRAKLILNGKVKPPLLYDFPVKDGNYDERMNKIMRIREKAEYLDLFPCKRKSFLNLLNEWRNSFKYSDVVCTPQAVLNYFNLFNNSSRLIHIALYYFSRAASLSREFFIEDAGINLHLAIEAILKDYMNLLSTKNKRKAAERFIQEVWPTGWATDYLDDLRLSRNTFLAHIDENMFTTREAINDPDMYCYGAFENVGVLITEYIRFKNIELNKK
jgi:hypothetical protein